MIKVVYDTNVIVSTQLKSGSWPALVLNLGLQDQVQTFVSPEILEEYREVLMRDKFDFEEEKIKRLVDLIKEHFEIVKPEKKVTAASDRDDNKFLECALESGADFVITGNKKDFPEEFKGVEIVNPSEFASHFIEEIVNLNN